MDFTGIAAAIANLLGQPIAFSDQCLAEQLGADCSTTGTVLMKRLDPERFLIAVDAQPVDGTVDHLFLFSRSSASLEAVAPFAGTVTIDFDGKRVQVQRLGQERVDIDFSGGVLAHYWGYGDDPALLHNLEALKESYPCDGPAGACWEAPGWRIYFPM